MPTFPAISSSVGARAELRLELGDRALDLAGARADGARHPVERAQLVDDRALDARDRVRLELDVAVRVEALDRADQAEQAVRDEVVLVDVRRQPAAEAAGDVLHERRVREDQPVAQPLVAPRPVLAATGVCVSSALLTEREYGVERGSFLRDASRQRTGSAIEPSQTASASARDGRRSSAARRRRRAPRRVAASATRAAEDARARTAARAERVPRRPPGAAAGAPVQSRATQGRSSIGRAPVSKTGGWRFESFRPCWLDRQAALPQGCSSDRSRGSGHAADSRRMG